MALVTAKLHIPLLALLLLGALLGLHGAATDPGGANPHVAEAEAVLLVNGQPRIADRRYNEVAYATTHNANASAAHQYLFPNQTNDMRRQLDDGIRALMIDLHEDGGEPMLCHGDCRLGRQPLREGLAEIAGFLAGHPQEVITLLLEPYQVRAKVIARAFAESGLLQHAYAHSPGAAWPTLREMVRTGKRLVVFTDGDPEGYPWLHPMWGYLWDTPWNVRHLEDFTCVPSRGQPGNDLFVLNHFVLNPLPFPSTAAVVNQEAVLLERAIACWEASSRIPNFVTVDYYELGPVVSVVHALNALAAS